MCVVSSGHTPGSEDVLAFQPITVDDTHIPCNWTYPPTCVTIDVDELDWLLEGRRTYYLNILVEGVNGLYRMIPSEPYEHAHGAPLPGTVIEIPLDEPEVREAIVYY